MLRIVTSNNSSIFRQLSSPAFQRVGLDHKVGRSGAEILELVDSVRPDLVIVDRELPDMSGYEVSRRIKAREDLGGIRVVLVLEGAVTMDVIRELGQCRCDEVLVTPAPGEELFHKVARLVGLPSRVQRRMLVELKAVAAAGTEVVSGKVMDLSSEGARLELEKAIGEGTQVKVRITGPDRASVVTAEARVIWQQATKGGKSICGIQFLKVPMPSKSVLEDWALWDVVDLGDGRTQVVLQGEFREHTNFDRLASRLSGYVEFDLSGVSYLNSAGVRKWVDFLRGIDEKVEGYDFVRCSVAFVNQAAMVPEVLGRGRILSFKAPYACDECDLEEERLLQTGALVTEGRWPPDLPSFACPRCGGDLVFDDLPARFFAFLQEPAPRRG